MKSKNETWKRKNKKWIKTSQYYIIQGEKFSLTFVDVNKNHDPETIDMRSSFFNIELPFFMNFSLGFWSVRQTPVNHSLVCRTGFTVSTEFP